MINKVIYKNEELIKIEKISHKEKYYIFQTFKIQQKDFINEIILIECIHCKTLLKRKPFYHIFQKPFECRPCIGKLKNSFAGKCHTEKSKKLIGKSSKGRNAGEKNYFFGKTHSEETKQKLREKHKARFDSLSEEDKQKFAENVSKSQKKLQKDDPITYRKNREKSGHAAFVKAIEYKKNKIESIVEGKLKELNINFKYSIILHRYQFDFGCKEHRILLEVHGDYWHSNPNIYSENSNDNKKKINDIQKKNQEKDKRKLEFCQNHNIKLFIIWEEEINNGDFKVLEEIKNEIQIARNKKDRENSL